MRTETIETQYLPVPLTVSRHRRAAGTQILIRVVGDVDLATAPDLAQELRLARRSAMADVTIRTVVVDLRPTSFFSCRGVAILLEANRYCPQLRVIAGDKVDRYLRLLGVDQLLALCDDLDAE